MIWYCHSVYIPLAQELLYLSNKLSIPLARLYAVSTFHHNADVRIGTTSKLLSLQTSSVCFRGRLPGCKLLLRKKATGTADNLEYNLYHSRQ